MRPPPSYPVIVDYDDIAPINLSFRPETPFSPPAARWREAAEEDLVTHLGPSERGRQEVMWEIVASEER
jgi:hypothetical protein